MTDMAANQEIDMKTSTNASQVEAKTPSIIVLGTASIETQGKAGSGETSGPGGPMIPGISED
ncbi:MAG TPA: benenodin family lasso peptide [Fontimonas sp.]